MTQTPGSRVHRRQRPGRPGHRRRARCPDRPGPRASASRMASGSRSSATGPRSSPRRSSATGCCSTRCRTTPVSSRSRSCRSTGPRTSTGPGRSPRASAGSGSRVSSRPVAACRPNPSSAPLRRRAVRCSCRSRAGGRRRRSVPRPRDSASPVVLTGSHYTTSVEDLAAGRRYEHLHLDTSSMAHFRAIETAVARARRRARPVRQRFAVPGDPVVDQRDPRRPPSRTTPSGRSWPATRHVCSASGTRAVELTDIVRPPRAIDVHTHTGPMPWDVPDIGDDALMPALVRDNATRYAVASNVLAIAADLEAGNRRAIEACARNEGLLGYLVADPERHRGVARHPPAMGR